MSKGKLHIVPLGGLGEFGMNCMAIRFGDDIIVIDAGLIAVFSLIAFGGSFLAFLRYDLR